MTKKFPSLKSKAVLSPMAGVTDVAFRALAKKYGAGLTYTEFVSSHALIQGSKKTFEMIQTSPDERPVAVQLFGNSEKDVVSAAKIVEEKFDIIDVNCGCPAWKVIQTGAGSALLNNPEKISHFISKLSSVKNIIDEGNNMVIMHKTILNPSTLAMYFSVLVLSLATSLVISPLMPKSDSMENMPTNANMNEYLPRPASPKNFASIIIRTKEMALLAISDITTMEAFLTILCASDI